MMESLALFAGICNLKWFRDVPFILFLNKDDVFTKKAGIIDLGMRTCLAHVFDCARFSLICVVFLKCVLFYMRRCVFSFLHGWFRY